MSKYYTSKNTKTRKGRIGQVFKKFWPLENNKYIFPIGLVIGVDFFSVGQAYVWKILSPGFSSFQLQV